MTTVPDVGRYVAALQGLQNLDNSEILPVVHGLLIPSDREKCFIAAYYRTVTNARSLLELKNASHFQAIATLARGMYELAVDVALIQVVQDAITKIYAYSRLERLRSAREKVALVAKGKTINASIEQQFIASNGAQIEAESQTLWPRTKQQRAVAHWSDLGLAARAAKLGEPFDEMYALMYRQLSWHVHPGLAGVLNLDASVFPLMCGLALEFAFTCYASVLQNIARELKIDKAVANIATKVELAKMLPFAEDDEHAAKLVDAMLGS